MATSPELLARLRLRLCLECGLSAAIDAPYICNGCVRRRVERLQEIAAARERREMRLDLDERRN